MPDIRDAYGLCRFNAAYRRHRPSGTLDARGAPLDASARTFRYCRFKLHNAYSYVATATESHRARSFHLAATEGIGYIEGALTLFPKPVPEPLRAR